MDDEVSGEQESYAEAWAGPPGVQLLDASHAAPAAPEAGARLANVHTIIYPQKEASRPSTPESYNEAQPLSSFSRQQQPPPGRSSHAGSAFGTPAQAPLSGGRQQSHLSLLPQGSAPPQNAASLPLSAHDADSYRGSPAQPPHGGVHRKQSALHLLQSPSTPAAPGPAPTQQPLAKSQPDFVFEIRCPDMQVSRYHAGAGSAVHGGPAAAAVDLRRPRQSPDLIPWEVGGQEDEPAPLQQPFCDAPAPPQRFDAFGQTPAISPPRRAGPAGCGGGDSPLARHGTRVLPSLREIGDSLDALKASLDPMAAAAAAAPPPAQPPQPPPETTYFPPEVKQTLDDMLSSLDRINTEVLAALSPQRQKLPLGADGTLPVKRIAPRLFVEREPPTEAERFVTAEIERLQAQLRDAEMQNEIDSLTSELTVLRHQQEEQEFFHSELLDLQILQQGIMAEQFQKQQVETQEQKRSNRRQRSHVEWLAEEQKKLSEDLQQMEEEELRAVVGREVERRYTAEVDRVSGLVAPRDDHLTRSQSQTTTASTVRTEPKFSRPATTPAYTPPAPGPYLGHRPSVPEFTPSSPPSELDSEVRSWLTYLRLERYIPVFARHSITMYSFEQLTDKDLVDMGVTSVGPRKVICRWLDEWKHAKVAKRTKSKAAKTPRAAGKSEDIETPSNAKSNVSFASLPSRASSGGVSVDAPYPSKHGSYPSAQPTPTIDELEQRFQSTQSKLSQHLQPPGPPPIATQAKWTTVLDQRTNKVYYVNNETNQTQWEQPHDVGSILVDPKLL
ncbi:hypothetical protein DIPPA_35031 [Diplonema papillatum]|nr:hypothetical protein DIPPA_35031 [Diplonema papillatum]KAJ9447664.1 hypothetical protein DIPPA_35031 [Diplonema papillatum]